MENNIEWKIKPFKALSVDELYEIMQLRSEVFVVEQNCVFLDMDGKDQKALHLFGIYNEKIVAYVRLFDDNQYFKESSIGRVVVCTKHRDLKFGHLLMQKAIEEIKTQYNKTAIKIGAQLYLKKFYESHGFLKQGEVYDEDGIDHIVMVRN